MTTKAVSFNPIAVTFETIDKLIRMQETDAVALYMAYSAVCHWQETYQPRATTPFMMKRLGWTEEKFYKAKKVLIGLNLIENVKDKGAENKIKGWYIKINHLVEKPLPLISRAVEKPGSGKTPPQVLSTDNLSSFNNQKGELKNSPVYEEIENTYNTKKKTYQKLGIDYKPSPKSEKQQRAVEALLLLDYFKDKASFHQGLEFFRHPMDLNGKMRKLAQEFYKRCDYDKEKAKAIIDNYCFEAGSWCQYDPSNCFTVKTIYTFENKDKRPEVLKL